MADTYPVGVFPGARPAKHVARALTYLQSLSTECRDEHHIVLGGEGGDIAFLSAVGVPAAQIHVAEFDSHAARRLHARFPHVNVYAEDVVCVAHRLSRERVGTCNLDFCGKLSEPLVNRVAAVMSVVGAHVYVPVTMTAGRETGRALEVVQAAQVARPTASTADTRVDALERLLADYLRTVVHTRVGYQSREVGSLGGSSMVVAVLRHPRRVGRPPAYVGRVPVLPRDDAHSAPRVAALALHDRFGLRAPEIAEILHEPRQRVAGWFAARTRELNRAVAEG